MSLVTLASCCILSFASSAKTVWPDRWAFEISTLEDDAETQGMIDYVNRAADAGYNGLALTAGRDYMVRKTSTCRPEGTMSELCGFEECDRWSAAKWANFRKVRAACDKRGMELIPFVWSVGYGSMMHRDSTLASVHPLVDVPYAAKNGQLSFVPEESLALPIPTAGEQVATFKIPVRPNAVYRISWDVKTADLPDPRENLRYEFNDAKSGVSRSWNRPYWFVHDASNSVWRTFVYDVHSGDGEKLDCRLGLCDGVEKKGAKLWYRNLSVRRIGFQMPIVRAGAPLVVKDAESGRVYEPGRDYVVPKTPEILLYHNQPMCAFELVKGGAIKEGARLLVSGYEPVCEWNCQFSACMQNPAFKDYLAKSADIVQRNFAPKRWFISYDEIRCGCRCEFCRATEKTCGRQLCETVCVMRDEIRRVSPTAEIYIWPDMFDPQCNAKKRYYQMPTTIENSWEGLPKDLVLAVWGTKPLNAFSFFAERGNRMLVATYYDEDATFTGSRRMFEAASKVPGITGWMYTPWRHSRDLLEPFARVAETELKRPERPEWENPSVNSVNRLPPRTYSMPLANEKAALTDALEFETPYRISLNGNWKYAWAGNPNLREKEFFRTDYDDADWFTIDVPSCVEMRGFGSPCYTNQKYPHANASHPTNAHFAAILDRQSGKRDYNPVSSYRTHFTVPESWKGRDVILRFDGVYSAYCVWVDGKKVGYAEDSKLPSEFDITPYLKWNVEGCKLNVESPSTPNSQPSTNPTNLLAVEVYRWCDGSYLEDQDMTRFSGIFRDVTLWAKPKDGIWDFEVKTTPVGGYENWSIEVKVDGEKEVKVKGEGEQRAEVSLCDAEFRKVADLRCSPSPLTFTFSKKG